jgi:hypothetical protein
MRKVENQSWEDLILDVDGIAKGGFSSVHVLAVAMRWVLRTVAVSRLPGAVEVKLKKEIHTLYAL